ncbi:hypothetical protein HELRODRAFT_168257 [Helobdella robusta]|uniref:CCDC92/74 N-terminal domain-containing protein n=1 Tax=Helobdella robusta TaxID=6412 RepID=T1F0D3_HELRO|nr:hypothetical protein HELRODRAFT_168257 [Helobdella robusta]ESO09295.1 hypothetical protein HELRODRAFT_168257 [Helobdella robusta]
MNFCSKATLSDLNISLITLRDANNERARKMKTKLEPLLNNNRNNPSASNPDDNFNLQKNHLSAIVKSSKYFDNDVNCNKLHHMENLEKSIQFLQSQHHHILGNLHNEIDELKHQNRELQLQIAKLTSNSFKKEFLNENTETSASHLNNDENIRLKKIVSALEKALKEETAKNTELLASLKRKNE